MQGRLPGIFCLLLLCVVQRADAVITAAAPLKKFEGDAVYIVVGRVEKFFAEKPAMIVTITEDIKGKAPFRLLPVNCKVDDPKTAKANLIEPLIKRLGPDLDIIFFITPRGNKSYITFAFTNGTWFQLQGTKVDADKAVFSLKSAEPYFHKTFRGTTAEMRKLLKDHAAGKGKLPPLDDTVKPGLGPEYRKSKGARNPEGSLLSPWGLASLNPGGSLFAVIPTLGIGAPLAILALLFPTVFGGVFVLFRQWMAFITAISINSTLMLVQFFITAKYFRGSFWGTDAALWLVMMVATFACLFWAWRRQLDLLAAGEREASRRVELLILGIMSVFSIAALVGTWAMADRISWSDAGWGLTVVLTFGVLVGTLYRAFHALKAEPLFGAPPLATEGVILASLMIGHLVLVPMIWGGNASTEGSVVLNEQAGNTNTKISAVEKKWDFTLEPRIKGMYASAPVIDGDAIYAAYAESTQYSTLVRLDRQTGLKKWAFFGKNDDLRQMISTPCLSEGKLYFGEGFHFDKNCNVFCVDAEKGEERWRYATEGQTESSPTIANGKLYIGAGNDGVYCFDVHKSLEQKKGVVLWHYPAVLRGNQAADNKRIQRFGGGMRVVGNRLYCATGVDRAAVGDKGETATFCFDANNGSLLWKSPTPYAVWSTPVVKDGSIYITSGNGDVFDDAKPPEKPGGAVQCLDQETGKEQWRFNLDNGVIDTPAVDAHRIYFGSRDWHVHCIDRQTGKELWKYFMQTPVIATPVLDSDPVYGRTLSVFAITSQGKVCCMNPQNGDIVWTFTPNEPAYATAAPRLVVTRTPDGYRRQLFFGCGLGGGTSDYGANRPVFYCLEDKVIVK